MSINMLSHKSFKLRIKSKQVPELGKVVQIRMKPRIGQIGSGVNYLSH